jgi:hypothetical protein
MEKTEKSEFGICYECSTKDTDSSEKTVYQCDVCHKWFCDLHQKAKLPYFLDWETMFDVQGNPEVKAFFYSEYGRQDGHADFIYLRKYVETLELEEKIRNQLIKQSLERMMEADEIRRYEKWKKEAKQKAVHAAERAKEKEAEDAEEAKLNAIGKATTIENKHYCMFIVPFEVYSNPTYREYLNNADSEKSVKGIVDEYNEKYHPNTEILKPGKQKKKHWWQ